MLSFSNVVMFFTLVRTGLLGVLELSERSQTLQPKWLQTVLTVLSLLQMLSFVTQDMPNEHTWPASLSPMEVASSLTNVKGYRRWVSPGAAVAAVWVGMAWVSTLILLLAWGIYCFSKNSFPFLWPLKVLRVMGQLSSTLLFIPLLQMLLQADCAQLQGVAACTPFGHYAQIVVAVLLAVSLLVLALLFTGVFFEPSMVSENLSAAAHGRAQALLLLLQVVLVLCTNTFEVADTTLRLVILFSAGGVWLASILYFLPYHGEWRGRAPS